MLVVIRVPSPFLFYIYIFFFLDSERTYIHEKYQKARTSVGDPLMVLTHSPVCYCFALRNTKIYIYFFAMSREQ